MRIRCLAVFAILLPNCGPGASDATLDITYDPCLARPDLTSATDEEAQATQRAMGMWQTVASDLFAHAENPDWIAIRFESAAPMFHGVYDDERGIVFINRDQAADPLAITIAHELGHAYGLPHVGRSRRSSVMNPGNTSVRPNSEDVAMLRELWGSCDVPGVENSAHWMR